MPLIKILITNNSNLGGAFQNAIWLLDNTVNDEQRNLKLVRAGFDFKLSCFVFNRLLHTKLIRTFNFMILFDSER